MKIAFNAIGCGLANNGGSRTILKCQETLNNLGHNVFVVSQVNKFTWFKTKNIIKKIPSNLDVLIAIHGSAVDSTLKSNAKVKVWYIRSADKHLDESFQKQLVTLYKKPIIKIVNSHGLKKRLKKFGIKSQVVHQGVDLDFWKNVKLRSDKVRIGCLYSESKFKKWDHFKKLSELLGSDFEYVGFGAKKCHDCFLYHLSKVSANKESVASLQLVLVASVAIPKLGTVPVPFL